MKDIVRVVLVLMVVFGGSVNSYAQFRDGMFEYSIRDILHPDEVSVRVIPEMKDEIEEIEIPARVEFEGEEYTVVEVAAEGFASCKNLRDVILPETLLSIGNSAFRRCEKLEKVNFPESLIKIEDKAFSTCRSLTSAILPASLRSIGDVAFCLCDNLTNVVLPDMCRHIGNHAFSDCRSIKKLRLPGALETIGLSVFMGCSGMERIELPPNLKMIDQNAFWSCTSLNELEIPASVDSIGSAAFAECWNLSDIHMAEDNPHYCVVDGMLLRKDKETLLAYPSALEITTPEYVREIGVASFALSALRRITITPNIEKIQGTAFLSCMSLESIVCLSPQPPEIAYPGAFLKDEGYMPLNCTVYVPEEALETYRGAMGWGWQKIVANTALGLPEAIDKDEEEVTVYTLDGTLLIVGGRSEDLYALPRGCYIVRDAKGNSRKVVR